VSRSKPETTLQADIVRSLRRAGFTVVRINSGKVKVRGGWMELAPEGCPDLYVIGAGWIETKTLTGKLSEAQKAFHKRIADEGEYVAVERDPADAVRICMQWRQERAR
jgi:hypothetical protein